MSHLALFLLLVVASLPSAAFAQGNATVAGRVLNMADGMPIGYASVVIENAATGPSCCWTRRCCATALPS